jgi:hypothetical protein
MKVRRSLTLAIGTMTVGLAVFIANGPDNTTASTTTAGTQHAMGQRQELHRNEIVQFDSYSTIKREP